MGPDKIHAMMLKELKEYIVTPLVAIMNQSLKQGSYLSTGNWLT